jgi:hypothetical protein
MALGARGADVVRLVVVEGMKPALVGVAAGIFGALALSGILAQLIYGVSATDPWTFAAVALLLACDSGIGLRDSSIPSNQGPADYGSSRRLMC